MIDPASLLPQGRSRETRIRRDALGRWWNDDVPITHPLLTKAFDAWVDVAEDGRTILANDINWAYVSIEGAPIRVLGARADGASVVLSLSDGREETLDPATLREAPDGALHCQVRAGRLAARFESHALVMLSDLVGEDGEGPYLRLGERVVRPPQVEDPLAFPLAAEPTSL